MENKDLRRLPTDDSVEANLANASWGEAFTRPDQAEILRKLGTQPIQQIISRSQIQK